MVCRKSHQRHFPVAEALEDRRLFTVVVYTYPAPTAKEGGVGCVAMSWGGNEYGTVRITWAPVYSSGGASADDIQPLNQLIEFPVHPGGDGISPIPVARFLPDNLVEGSESFTMRLSVTGAVFAGGGSTMDVPMTIQDDPPMVTVQPGDTQAAETRPDETPDVATFRVLRTGGDLTTPLAVTLDYSSTATKDVDYTAPTTVNVLSEALVTVSPIDDQIDETVNTDPGDTIVATVRADPAHLIRGNVFAAQMALKDNDYTLTCTPNPVEVSQAGPPVEFTVTLLDGAQPVANVGISFALVSQPVGSTLAPFVNGKDQRQTTDANGQVVFVADANAGNDLGFYQYVFGPTGLPLDPNNGVVQMNVIA